MMRHFYTTVMLSTLLAATVHAADTNKTEPKEGFTLKIQDQLRYEGVSQPKNAALDAAAATNRLVLGAGYDLSGFGIYAEATNVAALTNTYKDLAGSGGAYSVVADPAQSRLTQAKLTYKNKSLGVVVGRDMYTLDGHRFVGNVGWRQMPQTFDVAALCYKGIAGLKVKAAYVFGRHAVFAYSDFLGTAQVAGSVKYIDPATNSVLINANYKVSDTLNVRLYEYMISSASDTFGGMIEGSAGGVGYKIESARQTTSTLTTAGKASGSTLDATYYANLELSTKAFGAKFILGHEILGGNGTSEFSTPWATLHKFNGWADIYLDGTAGKKGIADTSLGAIYANETLGTFKAFYHAFHDASYTTLQGSELDLLYTRGVGVKGLKALVKAAYFVEGADGAVTAATTDTSKVWAMLTYDYTL